MWERYGASISTAAPSVEPVLLVDGERVGADDIARLEVAFFSPDVFPDSSANFMRVGLEAANLQWLHVFSAGVDHPVFGMFLDRGVRLTTSSGASATPIAHHVMMGLLAMSRDLPGLLRRQAAHEWADHGIHDLEGATVGIIGMGPIGCETARLATAFGMRPIGMRRTVQGSEPCATWTLARLDELLGMVDHLVLALPLTADTRGIIGARELALVRPGTALVNVGRGELLDEPALIEALQTGHIASAALDVFVEEPLPHDSPLWSLPNVIVTPHSAGSSAAADHRACLTFVDNLERFMAERPLVNEVAR